MARPAKHLALIGCVAALPWLMGADVYRWVDANGVVNYTQQRPKGVEAELVRARAGAPTRVERAPAGSTAAPAQPAQENLSAEQQAMLEDLQRIEAERQQEVARIKEDNCARAREVLRKLTEIGRIRVRDEKGEYRVLPEEERQQRIDEAQRGVAANCSASG